MLLDTITPDANNNYNTAAGTNTTGEQKYQTTNNNKQWCQCYHKNISYFVNTFVRKKVEKLNYCIIILTTKKKLNYFIPQEE